MCPSRPVRVGAFLFLVFGVVLQAANAQILSNTPIDSDDGGPFCFTDEYSAPPAQSRTEGFTIGPFSGVVKSAVYESGFSTVRAYAYQMRITAGGAGSVTICIPIAGLTAMPLLGGTSFRIEDDPDGVACGLDDPDFDGSPSPLSVFFDDYVSGTCPGSPRGVAPSGSRLDGTAYVTDFSGLVGGTFSQVFGIESETAPALGTATLVLDGFEITGVGPD